MTATERLRELLDERGVEWKEHNLFTVWESHGGVWEAFEYKGKLNVWRSAGGYRCTPEQAIEATLGREECRADETDTIKATYNDNNHTKHVTIHEMECSACGHTYEHVNGDYEYCPRCGRKVVER